MKILGADLSGERSGVQEALNTLALLDDRGRVGSLRHAANLPEVAATVAELTEQEPFVLGVNVPLAAAPRPSRSRPIDNLVRRRFGYRIAAGVRPGAGGPKPAVTGEALLAALAAAGVPCLPYPDRDRRRAGLAEIHPGLVLKALLWEGSPAARSGTGQPFREEVFRAYEAPAYRLWASRGRTSWAEASARLDLLLRSLHGSAGFDLDPTRESLAIAASDSDVERAGSVLDASLIAGTARRYLESPEACVFLGDPEKGYTILPADGFIRRMALRERPRAESRLFPRASLRERLEGFAEIRPLDLLDVPGRPQRLEAVFRSHPEYEFDNVDEMLWWKHCRHLSGPVLPVEGLRELSVRLGEDDPPGRHGPPALRLIRSRHRTLSFRFEPAEAWRARLATRDGKTYAFRVSRAHYEVLPAEG